MAMPVPLQLLRCYSANGLFSHSGELLSSSRDHERKHQAPPIRGMGGHKGVVGTRAWWVGTTCDDGSGAVAAVAALRRHKLPLAGYYAYILTKNSVRWYETMSRPIRDST
eukprot:6186990-Pleurochrysis_carterae.AAC.2